MSVTGRPWPPYCGSPVRPTQPPLGELFPRVAEAFGHEDLRVFPAGALLVADFVERVEGAAGELVGLGENHVEQVGGGVLVALGFGEARDAELFEKHEAEIAKIGIEGHRRTPRWHFVFRIWKRVAGAYLSMKRKEIQGGRMRDEG
ncbi:MAG: hypothetical protein M5R36_26485 [Deltaproteobacteria bacterium]|nr:hypothetical protein [Deltaproteobacteria bacterium]